MKMIIEIHPDYAAKFFKMKQLETVLETLFSHELVGLTAFESMKSLIEVPDESIRN
jgi:hypothetical protein